MPKLVTVLVVMKTSDKARAFGCEILNFTTSSLINWFWYNRFTWFTNWCSFQKLLCRLRRLVRNTNYPSTIQSNWLQQHIQIKDDATSAGTDCLLWRNASDLSLSCFCVKVVPSFWNNKVIKTQKSQIGCDIECEKKSPRALEAFFFFKTFRSPLQKISSFWHFGWYFQ